MKELFKKQTDKLGETHFLVLYWIAKAENEKTKYNITNLFDDLKFAGLTRTKQNAVAYVESLSALCFINLLTEHNRKNLYITGYGAKALEILVKQRIYTTKTSHFLEGTS